MQTIEEKLVPVTFGSDAAVQQLRNLAKRVEDCQAAVIETKRKQVLVHENLGMLELNGKDPKQEAENARQAVQLAEAELQRAKSNLNASFLAGRRDFDTARGEIVNVFRQSSVDAKVCQIRKLANDVEAVINKLADEFSSIEIPDHSNRLAAFDQGIILWNALVAQLAGPGNALIDHNDSVRLALANILLGAVRDIVRIEIAAKRLREAANAMQANFRLQIMAGSSKSTAP